MPGRLGKRGPEKKTPGSSRSRALQPSWASAGQIRTALNSVPLIVMAAIAERKAFAKVRIVFPLSGTLDASHGLRWRAAQNYSIAKYVTSVA